MDKSRDITFTVKGKARDKHWMDDLKVGDIIQIKNGESNGMARIVGIHDIRHHPGVETERTFDLVWH